MTRYEKRERWKRLRRAQIVSRTLGAIVVVICVIACFTYLVSGKEYTEAEQREILTEDEPLVRGTPTEEEPVYVEPHETDVVGTPKSKVDVDTLLMKLSAKGIVSSDTPELDIADDNFETVVEVVEAEAGNQCEEGQRLVVDTIGNEFGWDIAKVKITHNRYNSYPDGCARWRSSITEELRQLVADEWLREDKADGGAGVYFFGTGHYSQYGTPWKKVGDHYFSLR